MNKIKRFIAYILLGLSCLAGFASLSAAWFFTTTADITINAGGEVVASYFHCGDGSQNNPYVITTPEHLYNMTMLYQEKPGFAEENNYFQLGYNLDGQSGLEFYTYNDQGIRQAGYTTSLNMTCYPNFEPIGSENKPFGGTFNGSSLTINNLEISGAGKSDIGFFGYVSEDAEVKNLYLNNLTVNIANAIPTAHNHNNAYVGYIAGHIEDATSFTDTYVNNCEITGKSCYTKNDWGYFGRCDNAASLDQFVNAANGQGQGDDWGGSIDAKSYNDWIYGLYKTTITSTNGTVYEFSNMQSGTDSTQVFNTKTYSDFTLHFATNYKTGVYGSKGNYTSYNYYMNPDCFNEPADGLPVRNTSGVYSTVYQFKDNNYIPLKFTDETKTAVDSNNSGYIVGSAYGSSNVITASPKLASYYYSSIGNSLQDTYWVVNSALANKTLQYDDSKLEVLTYKNGWYRIEDSHNAGHTTTNSGMTSYTRKTVSELGLLKYDSARTTIKDVSESTSRMHGIHFENNEVSASNKITKTNGIKMHGETYNDLLRGSVEFHLKKNGYINFFAGTYYTATRDFNFFSIYKVNRTNGSISSVKRISQIYTNSSSGPKYVYKYSDNSYSEGTADSLVFDVAATLEADAPLNNALYYFEVPVNEGEYAMGMVPGKSASAYTGAYMIYLDLSAGAGDDGGTELIDDFGSVDYRSATETVTSNILLITYEQLAEQQVNIAVAYIESKYTITYSGDLTQIKITVLKTGYEVWFNETQLPDEIKTNIINLTV